MSHHERPEPEQKDSFSTSHWHKFESSQQKLATGLRRLFRLTSESLSSNDPIGASIDFFNQPSSHREYRGDRDVPTWWAKLILGSRLSEQFGITLSVPLIMNLSSLTRKFHADLDRFARNSDVDKDLALLITNDIKNAKIIAAESSRPIIVLEANRIIAGDYSLRDEFHLVLRSANHFSYSKVLKNEDDFYGREALLEEITDTLMVEQNNVGLFGLRKSGKSSLLQMTKLRLRKRGIASAIFDFSSNISLTPEELRGEIANKLIEASNSVAKDRTPSVGNASWSDGLTLTQLKPIAREIIQQAGGRCVVLFDETDLCLEPFRDGARGAALASAARKSSDSDRRQQRLSVLFELRGFSQELEDGLELLFVFAGVSTSLVESSSLFGGENYLYSFAKAVTVRPMDRDEIARLVRGLGKRSGIAFRDHRTIDQLWQMYGGHPFLVRMACSWLATSAERLDSTDVPFVATSDLVRAAIADRSDKSAHREVIEVLRSFYGYHPDAAMAIVHWANRMQGQLDDSALRLGIRYGILGVNGELTMNAISGINPSSLEKKHE